MILRSSALLSLIVVSTMAIARGQSQTNIYLRHDLVSDLPAQAEVMDKNLVNPWGITSGPATPFWISDNGTGVSTLYNGAGRPFPDGNPLVVTIPPPSGGTSPAAPTGVTFNSTTSFGIASSGPALFIFATEDGTISAWNLGQQNKAVLEVDNSSARAVYKGIAIANDGAGNFLYATNFRSGMIDRFDSSFASAGSFTDTTVPSGYAPFGIRNIGGKLYVTFAQQDAAKHDDVAGPGKGFVDVYDPATNTFTRLISNGALNSPWGLTLTPGGFGAFSNCLLVGNFGDGTINAFNQTTGAQLGTLLMPSGRPMTILGLWGLIFGNGGNGGDPSVLYFTAGIPGPSGDVESHGLFGEIRPQHP